jgi:microcystin-dependent protein
MAEPFVAEIRIFGFNFAPVGWAQCNGQVISIAQNTALFSLLGTTYGGNGQTTFALPNLQSSSPLGAGQGQGLSLVDLGETGGSENVTLLPSEMPSHTHIPQAYNGNANSYSGKNRYWAQDAGSALDYVNTPPNAAMASGALSPTGGSQPHSNTQPSLVLNFCIALQGVFPQRS